MVSGATLQTLQSRRVIFRKMPWFMQTKVGQLTLAVNCLDNIEEYDCKPNEVKLNTPLSNIDSGGFLGLKKILAFIMVSGGQDEAFFSDGFAKAKSKKLYSTSKKLMPNIFSGTCFKKHQNFLVEQRLKQESSTLFFYLLSTTDFSHDINQFKENVSLHLIGCLY